MDDADIVGELRLVSRGVEPGRGWTMALAFAKAPKVLRTG